MLSEESYVISTDSSADFTQEDVKKLGVKVSCLELTFDGQNYFEESGIKPENFYKEIIKGVVPKTTQITHAKYKEYFESILKKGNSVLHIAFSSGLSGTYNQALMAAKDLNAVYAENRVVVVDSLCASVGQGLLVHYACMKKKQENFNMDDLIEWIEKEKYNVNHFFTVNDLFYLKRGGRISKTAAVVGSVLSVKPMLTINAEGKIDIISKVRGMKLAIESIVANIESHISPNKNFGKIFVAHTFNPAAAADLKDSIKKTLNVTDVIIKYIGPSIGAHLGVGTIAAVCFGRSRCT